MLYDIIIIGGGISGLNSAYQLLIKNPSLKILLLEKNNYLGGRIKTKRVNVNGHTYIFEEGAGRLNDNHTLFLQLIDQLKLTKNLSKINSKITYFPSDHNGIPSKKSPFDYIKKVIKYSQKKDINEIQKYTFKEYCKLVLTDDEIHFILDSFGYYAQLVKMNAYNAMKLFHDGMNPDLQFYHLDPGFDSMIDRIKEEIVKMNGKIKVNSGVIDIKYKDHFEVFLKNKTYKSKYAILAMPKPQLLKFKILNSFYPQLNSIYYKSLCRIYSVFDKKDIWFQDIPKSTTNNNSRYIIPIDKENGLIMISYSDSKFADYWNKLYKKNEILLINKLKKNIYRSFHKKIENPIYTSVSYWKCAIGFWKKKRDSHILSEKILQPFENIPLFICGENYSEKWQQWMEGALETSQRVLMSM
jgi:protoporphyrinogen oxidase